MYRPLKDLNGIPGANNLIMCLTGYLRQDRDDIMVGICSSLLYWFLLGAYTHYVTFYLTSYFPSSDNGWPDGCRVFQTIGGKQGYSSYMLQI